MTTGGRLPEDIAAEQAYLAELRAEKEAAAQAAAVAQRAQLAAQGLLPEPSAPANQPAALTATPTAPGEWNQAASLPARSSGIAPELLAHLPDEALESLPPAARAAVEAARRAGRPAPVLLDHPSGDTLARVSPDADEAEVARLEAEVLRQVQIDLATQQASLGRMKHGGLVERFARWGDRLFGGLFGRKDTW